MCPIGCGQEETIRHALWDCPCAYSWELVKGWLGESIVLPWGAGLVIYGDELERVNLRDRKSVWEKISEGKRTLGMEGEVPVHPEVGVKASRCVPVAYREVEDNRGKTRGSGKKKIVPFFVGKRGVLGVCVR